MTKNKFSLPVLLSLFFILLSQSPLFSFEFPLINKSKIRVIAEPGKTIYGDILVENQTDKEMSLKLYLNDWQYLPAADGTKEFLAARTLPFSCASWITFSPEELKLQPFSKQKVNYSVRIPVDAKGGHFAALFFESMLGKIQSGQGDMQAGMNIAIRVANLFYVEPKGAFKREARINKVSFENEKGDSRFSIKLALENTGDTDITCAGNFHITTDEGMVLAREEFKNSYTFAGGKGELLAFSKAKIPKGVYSLVVTLDLGKALEEADLGRGPVITKEADIEFDANGRIVSIGQLK
jgi:hypothetical protein